MNVKDRALEIYNQHIALAATDGRLFRKTVMDQLQAETGCSLPAAATHYNTSKKSVPVEGLGRALETKSARKAQNKNKSQVQLQDDNECFTVIELRGGVVGRCQSFLLQGDASECFDSKIEAWPRSSWVMIKGLGPNSGDTFKLGIGEEEVKRFNLVEATV